jgi:phage tail-like protein
MPEQRPDLTTQGTLSTAALTSSLSAPLRGFRFTAEFTGLGTASFKSVEGFSSTVSPTDYREGSFGTLTTRKVPGLVEFGELTLIKGLYNNQELYTFFSSYLEGTTLTPVNGVIRVFDNAATVTASWSVYSAWPVGYESGGLNADSGEILVETLRLVHEGIYRDATPQA